MTPTPWLSIVTVVKDDQNGMHRTLKSLEEQDLHGTQYIVVDSSEASEDLPTLFKNIPLKADYFWQQASGIYPAMNFGLSQALGRYVYFLNAGDELLPGVLAETAVIAAANDSSWFIGQVEIHSTDGTTTTTPHWDYASEKRAMFARGRFAPHQGTFAQTLDLRALGGFDLRYQVAADYEAFLKLTLMRAPQLLPFPVARFYEGGISTQQWKHAFVEFHRARMEVLSPRGWKALLELSYTVCLYVKTSLYRDFWLKFVKAS